MKYSIKLINDYLNQDSKNKSTRLWIWRLLRNFSRNQEDAARPTTAGPDFKMFPFPLLPSTWERKTKLMGLTLARTWLKESRKCQWRKRRFAASNRGLLEVCPFLLNKTASAQAQRAKHNLPRRHAVRDDVVMRDICRKLASVALSLYD